jgi:hypothetical protein
MFEFYTVPRKGTVWLLDKTKALSDDDRKELLGYIGHLEQSENRLVGQIRNFFNSVGKLKVSND